MIHASLFSGIGACELAAEWMGWENLFHCEINPFGQRVLNYYWPESIPYNDITKTDFTIHRGTVDVLSGGFPCQKFSVAGKREGDFTFWNEMLRAVREIGPRWVVAENVRGFVNWSDGMAFDQVQADLENEGYEVLPFLLPACAVGAPHRRDRVWIIAYAGSAGGVQHGRPILDRNGNGQDKKFGRVKQQNGIGRGDKIGITTNSNGVGLRGKNNGAGESRFFGFQGPQNDWQNFPTQSPLCSRNDGFSAGLVGTTIHKHRKESLMAYGNSMVPQVVHQIFKAIEKYNTLHLH